MSICLDIIPSSPIIPTAEELQHEIEELIAIKGTDNYCRLIWDAEDIMHHEVLIEYLKVTSDLTTSKDGWRRCPGNMLPLSMDSYNYGWLSIDNYKVGFDFYFNIEEDSLLIDYMREEIEGKSPANKLEGYFSLDNASKVHHFWMLRGSVGRSCATWLLAGLTAAALAKLTKGIIFSDDGGADYARLPADPNSFLSWFPEWCYGAFC